MLVVKQKSNAKRKNRNSSTNGRSGNNINYNRKETFSKNNSYNKSNLNGNIRNNNYYGDNKSKNIRNDNCSLRSNTYSNNSIRDLSSLNSKSNSDLNNEDINRDDIYSAGFVTNELQSYLEKYISENQMVIFILNRHFYIFYVNFVQSFYLKVLI